MVFHFFVRLKGGLQILPNGLFGLSISAFRGPFSTCVSFEWGDESSGETAPDPAVPGAPVARGGAKPEGEKKRWHARRPVTCIESIAVDLAFRLAEKGIQKEASYLVGSLIWQDMLIVAVQGLKSSFAALFGELLLMW